MKDAIVLSGAETDAPVAAEWAEGRAKSWLGEAEAAELRRQVHDAYVAASRALCGAEAEDQMLMVCVCAESDGARFEVIADGNHVAGCIRAAPGLSEREREPDPPEGLTCLHRED